MEKKESKKAAQIEVKKENNLSPKAKKKVREDSNDEKKPLTKKEMKELLNILDDIPEHKKDNKNNLINLKVDNNQNEYNTLNNTDKKINDYDQLKNKEKQNDEKHTQSEFEHLSESEIQLLKEEGVHRNKGFADINYFRKIYKNILINFENFNKDLNSESSEENDNK